MLGDSPSWLKSAPNSQRKVSRSVRPALGSSHRARSALQLSNRGQGLSDMVLPVEVGMDHHDPAIAVDNIAGSVGQFGLLLASVEKRLSVSRSSALMPTTRAPALRNSGMASAKALASSVHPLVNALG